MSPWSFTRGVAKTRDRVALSFSQRLDSGWRQHSVKMQFD